MKRKSLVVTVFSTALLCGHFLLRPAAADCGLRVDSHFGGSIESVTWIGNRALFGRGSTLVIASIAEAWNPTIISTIQLPGFISRIQAAGNYAYVGCGNAGFYIVNFFDPANPWIMGELPQVPAHDLVINGQFAYVAMGSGIKTLNILNAANPVALGTTMSSAHELSLSGSHLYSVPGYTGTNLQLEVFSLANPSAPQKVAGVDVGNHAYDVSVSGSYAYVGAFTSGVKVYNVTNPAAPAPVSTCSAVTAARVALSGTRLYVGQGSGLKVLNITNPASITSLGDYAPVGFSPEQMVPWGNNLLVAAGTRFHIVNANNPASMTPWSSLYSNSFNWDVELWNDRAYVGSDLGIDILDVSNPDVMTNIKTLALGGSGNGIARSGLFIYVSHSGGMAIMSLQNPDNPTMLSNSSSISAVYKPTVMGNHVYICAGSWLRILNAINPSSPTQLGAVYLPDGAYRSVVSGGFAYVTTYDEKFHVVNVTTPSAPVLVNTVDADLWTTGIARYANFLYVCDGSILKVYNISAPATPVLAGSWSGDSYLNDVEVVGDQLYVSAGGQGVVILDISNPAAPQTASVGDTPTYAQGLAVSGNRVIVADYYGGVVAMSKILAGDTNCDGSINLFDIQPFTVAISSPDVYSQNFPDCELCTADTNNDGSVNLFDIAGFVDMLSN